MSAAEVERLRSGIERAIEQNQLEQALSLLAEIERIDGDPAWPRKCAVVLKDLGRHDEEARALERAARAAVKRGEVMLGVALLKQVLEVRPGHAGAQSLLVELHSAWKENRPLPTIPPPPPTGGGGSSAPSQLSIDPYAGRALEDLLLRELITGSGTPAEVSLGSVPEELEPPSPDGVFPIPLGDPLPDVVIDFDAVEEDARALEAASDAFSKNPLLSELAPNTFGDLLLNAELIRLKAGEELFHQGDVGDSLYLIAEGTLGVVNEGPPRRGLAKLHAGDVFGELAVLANHPRSASVVAITEAQVIGVNRKVVRKVGRRDHNFLKVLFRLVRDRSLDRLMNTHPLFTVLSERDRDVLKQRVRFLEADAGAALIEQGTASPALYILITGSAEAIRAADGKERRLGPLVAGDFFGEMSLLSGTPAVATVYTRTKCFLVELPGEAFLTIVHGRPEAAAYVNQIVERRCAEAAASLRAGAEEPPADGNVRPLL